MIDDALRPPLPLDPTAGAYKDWLHLGVLDPGTGAIGLFNASLHGSPTDPRSRAIGTALVHRPDVGWLGNVEVRALEDAAVGSHSIALEQVALAVDGAADRVLVSAQMADAGLTASIAATSVARPIDVEQHLPFGPGWISWYVAPRLSLRGSLELEGERVDLAGAIGYHDHNWGRWHWGDDVGWEWGVMAAADPDVTIVVSRTTDRTHRDHGAALVVVESSAGRARFRGPAVDIRLRARYEGGPLRRAPGALAALHQDRATPRLPGRVELTARDGIDAVELSFIPRAAAQLIAGDPARRGYGFVHELVGTFEATLRLNGVRRGLRGPGIFEYVD